MARSAASGGRCEIGVIAPKTLARFALSPRRRGRRRNRPVRNAEINSFFNPPLPCKYSDA
jgi:hypothetical protein